MTSEPLKITPIEKLMIDQAKICECLENVETNIKSNTEALNAGFNRVDKTSMKQFAALIGVIMALIGSKLIQTPWYVDVAVIITLITGTFLLITLIMWWKYYSIQQKAVRIFSTALMLTSSVSQICIYRPGAEPAPVWFAPLINGILILLAISLLWAGWNMIPSKVKK